MRLFSDCLYPLARGPPERIDLCKIRKRKQKEQKGGKLDRWATEYRKMMGKQAQKPPGLMTPQYAAHQSNFRQYNDPWEK